LQILTVIQTALLFNEGAASTLIDKDINAKEVYTYFGDTWNFYNGVS